MDTILVSHEKNGMLELFRCDCPGHTSLLLVKTEIRCLRLLSYVSGLSVLTQPFCILEDRDGHAYLLIPKGKTKQERPFPIVELGMGPLLEYMDEIIALRLTPEGTSRTLGKTNFRYLDEDPEKARDWYYLFDRVLSADGVVKRRGRLSRGRVTAAMQEALLVAAKANADGLFQMATYHPNCQHRRRKGQRCGYLVAQAGVTTCPCCGSSLSGKLGDHCVHILEDDLVCDGVANPREIFCPKCDMPLAEFLPITTHIFRHNSVSRAHRAGVSLAQNMRLHGHQTVPMHLRFSICFSKIRRMKFGKFLPRNVYEMYARP